MFTKHQENILGISAKENKVLESLKDSQSIFSLSKDTEIPRTTLYPIIKDLYKREFIKKENYGNRIKYQTISLDILGEMIEKIGLDLKWTNEKPKIQNIIEVANLPTEPEIKIETKPLPKKREWFKSFFS